MSWGWLAVCQTSHYQKYRLEERKSTAEDRRRLPGIFEAKTKKKAFKKIMKHETVKKTNKKKRNKFEKTSKSKYDGNERNNN